MDRPIVGITAPYRKSDYTYNNMLLDRIKDLETLVKRLEQRIAVLEKSTQVKHLFIFVYFLLRLVFVRRGRVRCGGAWSGDAGHGLNSRQGIRNSPPSSTKESIKVWFGAAGHGRVRFGMVRQGTENSRQSISNSASSSVKAGQGQVGSGTVRRGQVRHGLMQRIGDWQQSLFRCKRASVNLNLMELI